MSCFDNMLSVLSNMNRMHSVCHEISSVDCNWTPFERIDQSTSCTVKVSCFVSVVSKYGGVFMCVQS